MYAYAPTYTDSSLNTQNMSIYTNANDMRTVHIEYEQSIHLHKKKFFISDLSIGLRSV